MESRLVLVRHGEALHNVEPGVWSMGSDAALGLTLKGVRQADDLGGYLHGYFNGVLPDRIIHSSHVRAFQTASILLTSICRSANASRMTTLSEPMFNRLEECQLLNEFYKVENGSIPLGFSWEVLQKNPYRRWEYGTCMVSNTTQNQTSNLVDLLEKSVWFFQKRFSLMGHGDINVAVSHHVTISCLIAASLFHSEFKKYATTDRNNLVIGLEVLMQSIYTKRACKKEFTELLCLLTDMKVRHCIPYEIYKDQQVCQNVQDALDSQPKVRGLVASLVSKSL